MDRRQLTLIQGTGPDRPARSPRVRTEGDLRQRVLDSTAREFIARQETVFIATSDGYGENDTRVSAGPPGFVRVLGPTQLAWREDEPAGLDGVPVCLFFVDFFRYALAVQVNGYATVVEDGGTWVTVRVDETYRHTAERIPRLLRLA